MREHFRTKRFRKAVEDARIVGSVRTFQKDGTCYIERLIVYPEYRRRGIGSALLREIEIENPKTLQFELFTGDKSIDNIRLYERHGYRPFRWEPVNANLTMVFWRRSFVIRE